MLPKRALAAFLIAAAMPTLTVAADALHISGVWARATPPGAPTGAAYFRVTSDGPADRLVGVSSPVAGRATLHRSVASGGQVTMEHVDSVRLTADKPIIFRPRGYHVMLMQLQVPLKAGDSFPMTLKFEQAGERRVEVTVKPIGTTLEDMKDRPDGGHGR